MAHDGPCVSPWTAPSCSTEDFLAIVAKLQSQGLVRVSRWGEVDEGCMGALKRCVK